MATLTISEPTSDMLRAQADAIGVSVEAHVRALADVGARWVPTPRPKMTGEEIQQWLDSLKSDQPVAASLPPDFSRADIYIDHD